MPSFMVIGLNAFGRNLALELLSRDNSVVVVDKSQERVDRIRYEISEALRVDTTEKEALKALNIESFDHIIVCMGHQFEEAERTTLALKELNVKGITNIATSRNRCEILRKIGADRVVTPGLELARNLAVDLSEPWIDNFIFTDQDNGIAELSLTKELLLRDCVEQFGSVGVRIVAAKKFIAKGEFENLALDDTTVAAANDRLVAYGLPLKIAAAAKRFLA